MGAQWSSMANGDITAHYRKADGICLESRIVLFFSSMHPKAVPPSIVEEFAQGWLMDSSLTALSISAGESVEPSELIELCSGAKTVFSLATLACREHDRVSDCYRMWTDTLEVFQQARAAWADVPMQDPLIRIYVMQLDRLVILSRDRIDLYTISEAERRQYIQLKADGSKSSREESDDRSDDQSGHGLVISRRNF
jgi:hypothetical protein